MVPPRAESRAKILKVLGGLRLLNDAARVSA